MDNHLEKIRAAVINAIPEVALVQFGCRIERAGNVEVVVGAVMKAGKPVFINVATENGVVKKIQAKAIDDCRIIGRAITLSDIILLLAKLDPQLLTCMNEGGRAMITQEFAAVLFFWDHAKDSLELQSDRAKENIATLIPDQA